MKPLLIIITLFLFATIIAQLMGCAHSCSPNPSSMCHMSAEEIQERLAQ